MASPEPAAADDRPSTAQGISETVKSIVRTIVSAASDGDSFGTLLLPGPVTVSDIKSAYKKLAKMLHPDKTYNDKECANAFVLVGRAYERLTNELEYKRAVEEHKIRVARRSGTYGIGVTQHGRDAVIGIDLVIHNFFSKKSRGGGTGRFPATTEFWSGSIPRSAPAMFRQKSHRPPPSWATEPAFQPANKQPAPQSAPSPPSPPPAPFVVANAFSGGGVRHPPRQQFSSTSMCESLFGPDHPVTLARKEADRRAAIIRQTAAARARNAAESSQKPRRPRRNPAVAGGPPKPPRKRRAPSGPLPPLVPKAGEVANSPAPKRRRRTDVPPPVRGPLDIFCRSSINTSVANGDPAHQVSPIAPAVST